ncbi:MAG: hypothetical protein IPM24_12965 [Bryobacterales bacterium]|nr:hypothetical protein [Bryobacterales bacterium]
MEALVWILLPVVVAAGSALLSFYIMQARMEVAVAREREALSEARVLLESSKKTMTETIKATEEQTRRQALDDFLADVRVEERHFTRENRTLFLNKKSLVLQERIYFRNIPLSNWVEHETTVEEGADVDKLIQTLSVFSGQTLPAASNQPRKLLR